MKIKLQPGDYVDVSGLTEEQYDKVVDSFVRSGARDSYPDTNREGLKEGIYEVLEWYGNSICADKRGCISQKREIMASELIGPTLPAIGTKWIECEDGDVVEVVSHHNGAIVCWSKDEGYRPYDVSELSPLDERRKAVVELIEAMNRCAMDEGLAEHLYDEGYRKQ